MKDIIEHIAKAREEAIKNGIKANTIIIDSELARINELFIQTDFGYLDVPPMIMGLDVQYDINLKNELGYNFVITETKPKEETKELNDYSTEELLDEIKRRMCEE